MLKVPLGAIRLVSSYPKDKKIVFEIDTKDLEQANKAKTLDEIINEARIDYATGDYKSFSKVDELVADLRA